jgi:glyoxylase-like metal-dependent hydrolase (beta-lactamase superfamily II)
MYSTRVAEGIYLIDTFALGNANVVGAYVVRGSKVALVDCGYASTYQNVLLGLAEIGIAPSEVDYVIPTHVHLDHGGAAGHLMREMPNAELIAHERALPHLADPSRLLDSATRVFGKPLIELYGAPIPIPQERMTAVGEEMHLELGSGVTATLLHTPGHAPHQLSLMLEASKVLVTGDAVGVVFPGTQVLIPTTPPPSLDPTTLCDSVDRLRQLDPASLLIPHFGIRNDPEPFFDGTKRKMNEWVDGIKQMKKRGLTFDEMVERMVAETARESAGGVLPAYAKSTARTSVMGITHYLEKTNA